MDPQKQVGNTIKIMPSSSQKIRVTLRRGSNFRQEKVNNHFVQRPRINHHMGRDGKLSRRDKIQVQVGKTRLSSFQIPQVKTKRNRNSSKERAEPSKFRIPTKLSENYKKPILQSPVFTTAKSFNMHSPNQISNQRLRSYGDISANPNPLSFTYPHPPNQTAHWRDLEASTAKILLEFAGQKGSNH